MKRGAGLLILAFFAIMLPQTIQAEVASNLDSASNTALLENAVILTDAQLEEIKAGVSFGGWNISLEFPNFQGGTSINIALPEITITRPEQQVITITGGGVSIQ